MFFGSLFRKDHRHFVEKGEKYLADERYADARIAFEEAEQRIPSHEDEAGIRAYVTERISFTRDRLALLNLAEAEHAHARRDYGKAEDHLVLAEELAEDVAIREKAAKLRELLSASDAAPVVQTAHSACSGCAATVDNSSENTHIVDDSLCAADRFDLLIHTLPGGLPQRYADLGEKFACAYLLDHDGHEDESLKIYEELLSQEENDIILYQVALIKFKKGSLGEAEQMMRRSIELNAENPLAHFGLVQFLTDRGMYAEAIHVLDDMIQRRLLPEQSLLLRGDLFLFLDQEKKAIDSYTEALSFPVTARAAAEKLISLLEQQGRSEEARFLFKKYLKGCC